MQDLSGQATTVKASKFDLVGYFNWRLEVVASSGTVKRYGGHRWPEKPDSQTLPNRFSVEEVKL
jgi:hypothetical protein